MPVYKILYQEDYEKAQSTGLIPFQPADKIPAQNGQVFIHACDEMTLNKTINQFYAGSIIHILELNLETVMREGFTVRYESNPGGSTKYWHIYHSAEGPRNMTMLCVARKNL